MYLFKIPCKDTNKSFKKLVRGKNKKTDERGGRDLGHVIWQWHFNFGSEKKIPMPFLFLDLRSLRIP